VAWRGSSSRLPVSLSFRPHLRIVNPLMPNASSAWLTLRPFCRNFITFFRRSMLYAILASQHDSRSFASYLTIKTRKIGKRTVVLASDLEDFLKKLPVRPLEVPHERT
jgi:hypothetical protein